MGLSRKGSEIMKYIKIKDYDLLEVLGDVARNPRAIGLKFFPQHQMIDSNNKVSYGIIEDESKFNIQHQSITLFDTAEQVNSDIDHEYSVVFILSDIDKLTLDIQLSGGIDAVTGYNPNKALDSQENLKALLDRDMAGIAINRKADYFTAE